MIDPELRQNLEVINGNLAHIKRGTPWWKAFINGIMSGFGSIIGVAIALVVLGWVLNLIGIIPAFKKEAAQWQELLQKTQQKIPAIKGETSVKAR